MLPKGGSSGRFGASSLFRLEFRQGDSRMREDVAQGLDVRPAASAAVMRVMDEGFLAV